MINPQQGMTHPPGITANQPRQGHSCHQPPPTITTSNIKHTFRITCHFHRHLSHRKHGSIQTKTEWANHFCYFNNRVSSINPSCHRAKSSYKIRINNYIFLGLHHKRETQNQLTHLSGSQQSEQPNQLARRLGEPQVHPYSQTAQHRPTTASLNDRAASVLSTTHSSYYDDHGISSIFNDQ